MTEATFIETSEYERFQEFCEACRKYEYIGLCYGPPGVGKTVSARYYADLGKALSWKLYSAVGGRPEDGLHNKVVFYTPTVINSPRQIARDIAIARIEVTNTLLRQISNVEQPKFKEKKRHLEKKLKASGNNGASPIYKEYQREKAEYSTAWDEYRAYRRAVCESTILIVIDEADRLKMTGLEQVRAVFDQGGVGLVLIGMPGLEKRLARYPQLYSRVGFVHQFRALPETETRRLLQDKWKPAGVNLPSEGVADEEAIARILQITGGNFRLLERLLTQIARILEFNVPDKVTVEIVEAARETLVIGAG